MRNFHPDKPSTLEAYRCDHDRQEELERVRAVKDVVHNGCIKHKAEQNNAEHQPTNYTKRDAEFSKENPTCGIENLCLKHLIPNFGFYEPLGAWNGVPICAQDFFCLYGMQQNSRQRRPATQKLGGAHHRFRFRFRFRFLPRSQCFIFRFRLVLHVRQMVVKAK